MKWKQHLLPISLVTLFLVNVAAAQTPHVAPPPHNSHLKSSVPVVATTRPKLVVVLVVDQMRADYVDKFKGEWTGGLKRLVEEGAWFREAA